MSRADTEDLVAEVFAIAWRRFEVVPVEDPTPWLVATARNVWRNQLRSAARLEEMVARTVDRGVASPADVSGSPSMAVIGCAMAALRDDDQEILRLVAWDGLTPAQVAVVLGCSSTAARVRLHRARARFARQLAALETRDATDPDEARPDRERRTTEPKEVPRDQSSAR